MTNNSGKTVKASSVSNNGVITTLTIPENGYYTTSSKIQATNSEININDGPIWVKTVISGLYTAGHTWFDVSNLKKVTFGITKTGDYGYIQFYGTNEMTNEDDKLAMGSNWTLLYNETSTTNDKNIELDVENYKYLVIKDAWEFMRKRFNI